MTKTVLITIMALLGVATAYPAAAEEAPTPEQQAAAATSTRQAVFKLLYFNLGPIVGMARGEVEFDAAIAERNARRIAAIAPMIPDVFGAMDTREFDVTTQALPVIWDDMAEFSDKAAALVEAAGIFADTAAGGDQAATLGGLRSLGGACGNCHDTFRVDDD
jgi:cytochrome c556